MTNLIEICVPKIFTLAEANELVPLLLKITYRHESAVQDLLDKQRYFLLSGASAARIQEGDTKVGKEMVVWGAKMKKLGVDPLAGGFCGLNAGCFYWSWRPWEERIEFYHDYKESPLNRRQLSLVTGAILK